MVFFTHYYDGIITPFLVKDLCPKNPFIIYFSPGFVSGFISSTRTGDTKKSDKADVTTNCRPIAVVSTFSKLFESIISRHITQQVRS